MLSALYHHLLPQMCQILLFAHFILLRLGGIKAEIGVVAQRKKHERNRIDTNLVIFDNLIFLCVQYRMFYGCYCIGISLHLYMPCINLFKLHVFPCYLLLLFCFFPKYLLFFMYLQQNNNVDAKGIKDIGFLLLRFKHTQNTFLI